MNAEADYNYRITLYGGKEHGSFEVIPPVTHEHYAALMDEPRLSWSDDFYLERGDERDSFLLGHYFNNNSGYGEYYNRAKFFANVVGEVLRRNGASVLVTQDEGFEERAVQRLRQIHETNNRR